MTVSLRTDARSLPQCTPVSGLQVEPQLPQSDRHPVGAERLFLGAAYRRPEALFLGVGYRSGLADQEFLIIPLLSARRVPDPQLVLGVPREPDPALLAPQATFSSF